MDIPDVLCLVPDCQELLQFNQEAGINLEGEGEPRKLWCALGMECEVPECKPLGKFNSFREYMDHWTKVHRSTVPLYKCTLCGKQFAIHSMGKGHLKTNGERGVLVVKEVPNRFFVNSGTFTPYRLGSKEERQQGIEKERSEAQMKWRGQAKNLFASFPLVEENRVNSKDEVFPGETSDVP